MPTFNCKQCNKPFNARQADRNRGWARYCSKSCKAKNQVQTIPYNKDKHESYIQDAWYVDDLEDVGHPLTSGFFGHGQDT